MNVEQPRGNLSVFAVHHCDPCIEHMSCAFRRMKGMADKLQHGQHQFAFMEFTTALGKPSPAGKPVCVGFAAAQVGHLLVKGKPCQLLRIWRFPG